MVVVVACLDGVDVVEGDVRGTSLTSSSLASPPTLFETEAVELLMCLPVGSALGEEVVVAAVVVVVSGWEGGTSATRPISVSTPDRRLLLACCRGVEMRLLLLLPLGGEGVPRPLRILCMCSI